MRNAPRRRCPRGTRAAAGSGYRWEMAVIGDAPDKGHRRPGAAKRFSTSSITCPAAPLPEFTTSFSGRVKFARSTVAHQVVVNVPLHRNLCRLPATPGPLAGTGSPPRALISRRPVSPLMGFAFSRTSFMPL